MTSPVAVAKRQPTIAAEKEPNWVPEPCVPVAIAPAILCASISPWLRRPKPFIPKWFAYLFDSCACAKCDSSLFSIELSEFRLIRQVR
jgi:hypothetical protein